MASNPYPYGPGSQIQPYTSSLKAVAAQDSTAIFTGPLTPPGQTFSVSLQCSAAPDTGVFVAEINGAAVGNFRGGNTYGPLQIVAGNQLVITATGLVPGVTYYLTLTGIAYTSVITLPSYPAAYADSVTTATQQIFIGGGSFSTTSGTYTVEIQPLWRSIYVVADQPGSSSPSVGVLCVGNQSGIYYPIYQDQTWKPENTGGPQVYLWRIPVVVGLDTSVTLTITNTGAATTTNYWIGADLSQMLTDIGSISPGVSLGVISYGGGLKTAAATTTALGFVGVVPAPAPNQSIRVWSVIIGTSAPSSSVTPFPFLFATSPTNFFPPFAQISYPYQQTIVCGGQIGAPGYGVFINSDTTAQTEWVVTYDVIYSPFIS